MDYFETKDTASITPPEKPSPTAKSRVEGLSVIKANAAPIVVANPAKPVKIRAVSIVLKLIIVS